eukprot:s8208_g1.t1
MQFDIGSILGADFTSMLQALIQQQVQAAVQAVTEAPPRKRRKGKGKGATNPTAPMQEFVDQSPTGPAKGSKGKGNSSSPQSGDNGLNGRGQQPLRRQQHPAKGSGRSTSTPEDSEGWTKIQRKKDREADTSFELRQQDWNAPVISFASLAKKLDDTKAGEVCKGVIMCTHHEVQVAQSLFAGTSKAHALLLIVPCRDFPKDADKPTAPKEKIPGKVGLMLRSVDAYAYRVWSHGQSAPQPIGISTAPATITPKATTVLFVKVPQAFAPSAVWKGFIERPQKQIALWTAQHHVLCIDCFAFAEEQLKGGHKQVYGVIRVAVADSSTLLAASGEQGIFVQVAPPRQVECKQIKGGAVPFVDKTSILDPVQVSTTAPQTEEPPATTDQDDNKEPPPAPKRIRTTVRHAPKGTTIRHQPRDGDCLFHSFRAALKFLNKRKDYEAPHPHELRARMVDHLKRYEDQYRTHWENAGKIGPTGAALDKWARSLSPARTQARQSCARSAAFMMYASSSCRKMPTFMCVLTTAKHPKRTAAIFYTEKHFDFLEPDDNLRAIRVTSLTSMLTPREVSSLAVTMRNLMMERSSPNPPPNAAEVALPNKSPRGSIASDTAPDTDAMLRTRRSTRKSGTDIPRSATTVPVCQDEQSANRFSPKLKPDSRTQILRSVRAEISRETLKDVKRQHRREAHPRVTDKTWQEPASNPRNVSRIISTNRHAAASCRADMELMKKGHSKFSWPLARRPPKSKTILSISVVGAWNRCNPDNARKNSVIRLKELRKEQQSGKANPKKHGIPEEMFDSIFAGAERALTVSPPAQPSSA